MTHLITADSLPSHVARQAGGKGASLCRLSRAGLPVPRFAVLPASAFDAFVAHNALAGVIAQASDEAGAARARDAIVSAPLPGSVESAIRAQANAFAPSSFAVRSSALDEDGGGASFAGQHDTFLFLDDADAAVAAVRACWASAFSERAVSYRRERKMPPARGVAVVLQQMVDADASAVVFTCDPIRGDRSRIVINAALGLGDGLVSGQVDADTVTVDKASGDLVACDIADKAQRAVRIDRARGHGTTLVDVPLAERAQPALDDDTVARVVALAKKVEELAGAPQDIELCVKDGAVFLLQARPVTTAVVGEGRLQLWDNSNIVESYGGVTLPLTFDFARYVYRQVYVQFCEILLVPKEQLLGLERFLKNMLGIVNGRIYYNILNWYRLTSILPGFKHNRRFMEQMMGTHHSLGDALADEVRALAPNGSALDRLRSRVARFVVGAKFVWQHFTIGSLVKRFLANFEARYAEYRSVDWSRLDASAILDRWYALERTVLRRWHAPIINDYLCMVHFGILRAICGRWLPEKGEGFVGELMSGVGDLTSIAPAQELAAIAAAIGSDARARALIEGTGDADCLEALRREGFAELQARIEKFINDYGHRCMDEMKLEAKDLFHDNSFAFACIKNMLAAPDADAGRAHDDGTARRTSAEAQANASLSWWKRAVLSWSLKHARRAVRDRESTRLCRTRIYGVVRAMMRAIGEDFVRRGLISAVDDVFYLRLEEVFGVIDGTLSTPSHKRDVELRKADYARFATLAGPSRIETRGAVYASAGGANTAPTPATTAISTNENVLVGTPCAPGVVEGVVRVVRGPADAVGLNGEILVAERTDPGWIPLYPSVSGLLVERGGLLSHSAIVARESGLPTIVGVEGLCARLQTGMRVRFSGDTGHIEILGHDGCTTAGEADVEERRAA